MKPRVGGGRACKRCCSGREQTSGAGRGGAGGAACRVGPTLTTAPRTPPRRPGPRGARRGQGGPGSDPPARRRRRWHCRRVERASPRPLSGPALRCPSRAVAWRGGHVQRSARATRESRRSQDHRDARGGPPKDPHGACGTPAIPPVLPHFGGPPRLPRLATRTVTIPADLRRDRAFTSPISDVSGSDPAFLRRRVARRRLTTGGATTRRLPRALPRAPQERERRKEEQKAASAALAIQSWWRAEVDVSRWVAGPARSPSPSLARGARAPLRPSGRLPRTPPPSIAPPPGRNRRTAPR